MNDEIAVLGLRVWSHIGVTATERAIEQQLEVDMRVLPSFSLTGLEDKVEGTLDYDKLREAAKIEASRRPRNLLETLAQDIAFRIASTCAIAQISITVRKFIHPDCQCVSVSITRNVEKET
jgi:dihydroneopterin aldolase